MVNNFEILEKNLGEIKELKVVGELDALVAPKLKERITKLVEGLSLIHISEPTRQQAISYAV